MRYVVRWETIVEAPNRTKAAILATQQPRIFLEVRQDIEPLFFTVDLTKPSS